MVLSRLRRGLLLEDVTHRFGLSTSHVSCIWITWIAFLYQRLHAPPIWPSRQFVDANMPAYFKIKLSSNTCNNRLHRVVYRKAIFV